MAQDATATATTATADVAPDGRPAQQLLLLDEVVRESLEKNPEAQSLLHTVNALERRVPRVKSLPDPMVSVGWMGNLTPFSLQRADPSSYRGLTVSEQIPYPGKLKLRARIAGKDAEAAYTDYDATTRVRRTPAISPTSIPL